ncbi:MAG: class I tRNA ligase family protein [Ferrimicrobium sp.]
MGAFYITTPIFYVNGDPHLGTAYAAINADAFARWRRQRGDEVRFVTGTDEHGLKIAQAAAENGCTPQEWVDGTSGHFIAAWDELGISFDDFVRTTEVRHVQTVQRFLGEIYDRGYIYKGPYHGLYCVACEAYYAEVDLLEGLLCPVHRRVVVEMEEENYFFALSRFTEVLLSLYESEPERIFPRTRRNEVLGFLRQGLEDISITRTSIDWGVPVPWDPGHVFYVWYDALVNYLTAISYGVDDTSFSRWWPSVHHLLGKDILRFHAVWWPAMCLAAGIDPPHRLLVSGWMLVGGEKMSKSMDNQIDPLSASRSLGRDALRYYLLRANSFGSDGDVSLASLSATYNTDLANDLGNLASRVVAVIKSKFAGIAPAIPAVPPESLSFEETLARAIQAWDDFRPQDALEAAMELVRATNALLESVEPWRREPGDPESAVVLGCALEVLRVVAGLVSPAMPDSGAELIRRLGGRSGELVWSEHPGGTVIDKHPPLFPRNREILS